jgi:hypothetical protein
MFLYTAQSGHQAVLHPLARRWQTYEGRAERSRSETAASGLGCGQQRPGLRPELYRTAPTTAYGLIVSNHDIVRLVLGVPVVHIGSQVISTAQN